jgi:hypothetical protein
MFIPQYLHSPFVSLYPCPSKIRYNQSKMTAGTVRLLLLLFLFAMYVLALLSLRRRPLTWFQFAAWALFALLVPALGPFLVILLRPGQRRPPSQIVRSRRRRFIP